MDLQQRIVGMQRPVVRLLESDLLSIHTVPTTGALCLGYCFWGVSRAVYQCLVARSKGIARGPSWPRPARAIRLVGKLVGRNKKCAERRMFVGFLAERASANLTFH